MAEPDINTSAYDKAARYKLGHGYGLRVKPVTSIVVHSTSNPNQKNTAFVNEAKFLFDAALVSAHYLVGKDGRIVRFLDPRQYIAWHAGNARAAYANTKSIGVELHHSVGDPPYPPAQLDALSALARSLMALFTISIEQIETHGQIALPGPYQRKTDPSDMSYDAFLVFRARLDAPPPPSVGPYRVRGLPIHEAPSVTSPVALGGAAILAPGAPLQIDQVENGWAHVPEGFIDVSALEAL